MSDTDPIWCSETTCPDVPPPAATGGDPRPVVGGGPQPGDTTVRPVHADPGEIEHPLERHVFWDLDPGCRLSLGPEEPEDEGPQRWEVYLSTDLAALRPENPSVTPDAYGLHRWVTPGQVREFALLLLSTAGHGQVGHLRTRLLAEPTTPDPHPVITASVSPAPVPDTDPRSAS